jgi:peptidoglycan/LPS O-acetylase OafA/YrhL
VSGRTERTAISRLSVLAVLSFGLWFALEHHTAGLSPWEKLLHVTLAPHLFMFLIGVILQRHRMRLAPMLEGRAALWLLLYCGARLLQRSLDGSPVSAFDVAGVLSVLMSAGSFGLLALFTVSAAYTRRAASEQLLHGHDLSYGVYIYHMLVVNAFVQLGWIQSGIYVVGVLAFTVALAAASWVFVERPALSRKRPRRVEPLAVRLQEGFFDDLFVVSGK